jgi:single-stranded-DNA-specific exonuclease
MSERNTDPSAEGVSPLSFGIDSSFNPLENIGATERGHAGLIPEKVSLADQESDTVQSIIRNLPADNEKLNALPSGNVKVLAEALAAKGISSQPGAVKSYIEPNLEEVLTDPLHDILNMEDLCNRIIDAVETGKKIAVYSDYDVDGTTAAAQIILFFRELGIEVGRFVSHRLNEGYGVKPAGIDRIADQGYEVVLCLDQGSVAAEAMARAKERGLETLVMDHHEVSDPDPNIDAHVNPAQPECRFAGGSLCGSGLAQSFLRALKSKWNRAKEADLDRLLPLTALGTVCDVVPLGSEQKINRAFVREGLDRYQTSGITGLAALAEKGEVNGRPSCSDVGFKIGPLMNAASRMQDADILLELLITDDENRARELADHLGNLRAQVQESVSEIMAEVEARIEKEGYVPAAIAVANPDWHPGVIGIAAGRLAERYNRPTCLIGGETASARGRPGFSVTNAFKEIGEDLIVGGGHAAAGGGRVAPVNQQQFCDAYVAEAVRQLGHSPAQKEYQADFELKLSDIDFSITDALEFCEPCGQNNPSPTILFRNLKVREVKILKEEHLSVSLTDGEYVISAFMGHRSEHPALEAGAVVDLVGSLEKNEYQGSSSIRLHIQGAEQCSAAEEEDPDRYYKLESEVQDIQTPRALQQMVEDLSNKPLLVVDTETIWDSSVGQKLCLVQIYDPEDKRTYLVDAVALEDLSGLEALIANPDIVKIEHYSPFEEERFREIGIEQTAIEDTCALAKKLLPQLPNHKLQTVAAYLAGIDMSKQEQQSDWSRRPLSINQRKYAVADVEITYKIYEALKSIEAARLSELEPLTDLKECIEKIDDVQCQLEDLYGAELKGLLEIEARVRKLKGVIAERLSSGCLAYEGEYGHVETGGSIKVFNTDAFIDEFRKAVDGHLESAAAESIIRGMRLVRDKNARAVIKALEEEGMDLGSAKTKDLLDSCKLVLRPAPNHQVKPTGKEEKPEAGEVDVDTDGSIPELMKRCRELQLRGQKTAEDHSDYVRLRVRGALLLDEARRRIDQGEKYTVNKKAGEVRHAKVTRGYPTRGISIDKFRSKLIEVGGAEWTDKIDELLGKVDFYIDSKDAQRRLDQIELPETPFTLVSRGRVPTGEQMGPDIYINVIDVES